MKNLKKVLAVALAVVLTLSCMSVLGYSVKKDVVPTILIPGLFQCEVKYYENGELALNADGEPLAEPFFIDADTEFITDALSKALIPVSKMLISQEDKDREAAKAVAEIVGELVFGRNLSDAEGNMMYDIRPTVYEGSFADISDHDRKSILEHFPLQEYIDEVGGEYLYVFSYVSTGNMIQTANDLYDYIQFVKEDSKSDKVNIIPISQGGSISNGLLKVYDEKNVPLSRDINRIVYAVPALDGAALLGELYKNGFNDNSEDMYNTMLPSVLGVEDYLPYLINVVLRIMPKADIVGILDETCKSLVNDYMRYSTLLWGLIPTGDYEQCREMYLMDEGLEEIRRQADWYYEAQTGYPDRLLKAVAEGVKVFDVVDTNVELYKIAGNYKDVNADGMIHISSTGMGTYTTGVNEKLPADYVRTHNNCTDPENHDHTDPEGVIDACTALFPDRTFYFSGQNHADTASNDVLMSLIINLVSDESFTDVYSYPDKFPQFNMSRNTKSLRSAVEDVENIDRSTLDPEVAAELDGAIEQVNEMLANTIIDVDEFNAANDRFMAVYDEINTDAAREKGIDRALYIIAKTVSDVLYFLYEDAAFSEFGIPVIFK